MRKYPLASASEVFSEEAANGAAFDAVDSVADQSTCEVGATNKRRECIQDRHIATPSASAAAVSSPRSTIQNMHVVSSSSEIHAAWAAVWEAQREVEQREQHVSEREAA
eukprot:3320780-Amphidinium_carterae.1